MDQYEIKITGKVQGVGYRYFAKQQAHLFNLKGWVRNTADNGVLVLVQGDKEVIETFTDYLWIGPTMARVRNVTAVQVVPGEAFNDFTIRP